MDQMAEARIELRRFPSSRKINVEGELSVLQRYPSRRMLLDTEKSTRRINVDDPNSEFQRYPSRRHIGTEHTQISEIGTASTSSCNSFSDDKSLSSNDSERIIQKLRFAPEKNNIRFIENCFSMSPHDRFGLWYGRNELCQMKLNSRTVASQTKTECTEAVAGLANGYHQSKLIADAGIEMDEIEHIVDMNDSLVDDLGKWSAAEVNNESCRGIEKTLLRRDREAVSSEARHFVIEAGKFCDEDEEYVAEVYGELSRYAALFAHALAQADADAAYNNKNKKDHESRNEESAKYNLRLASVLSITSLDGS